MRREEKYSYTIVNEQIDVLLTHAGAHTRTHSDKHAKYMHYA